MTDLRQAAQQALDALKSRYASGSLERCGDAITALRTALEQQQAKPVVDEAIHAAWSAGYVEGEKAVLEQQAEPVASIYVTLSGDREFDDWKHELPVGRNFLYTAQPQRKPLTDEEIDQLLPEIVSGGSFTVITYGRAVARAIEAAYGIKENT